MIFVYVIKSQKNKFRYTGITENLDRRLTEHNSGKNDSTSFYKPFDLIYTEKYKDYKEARRREKFLKSGQGRKFLDTL
jgi:putative endonuclease